VAPYYFCRAHNVQGHMRRVGQNRIYTVYTRYFWQGTHQIYGRIQCLYIIWPTVHIQLRLLVNNARTLLTSHTRAHAHTQKHTLTFSLGREARMKRRMSEMRWLWLKRATCAVVNETSAGLCAEHTEKFMKSCNFIRDNS